MKKYEVHYRGFSCDYDVYVGSADDVYHLLRAFINFIGEKDQFLLKVIDSLSSDGTIADLIEAFNRLNLSDCIIRKIYEIKDVYLSN